jgi:hypothetical protein
MIGLISTMAEENQAFRLNFNTNYLSNGIGRMGGNLQTNVSKKSDVSNLIHVSDDDDSSNKSDSESEDDTESDSDNDSENNSDYEDDDDDDKCGGNNVENKTHVIKIADENLNIAIDNFSFDINKEKEKEKENENEYKLDFDSDTDSDIEEIHEINFDIDEYDQDQDKDHEREHDHEHIEIFDFDKNQSNNIKTIHLEIEQMSSTNEEIKDVSIFKAMNNSDTENSASKSQKIMDTVDYKKMSITKLREIVSKQGTTDASKLKKPEILKLLGVEQ